MPNLTYVVKENESHPLTLAVRDVVELLTNLEEDLGKIASATIINAIHSKRDKLKQEYEKFATVVLL